MATEWRHPLQASIIVFVAETEGMCPSSVTLISFWSPWASIPLIKAASPIYLGRLEWEGKPQRKVLLEVECDQTPNLRPEFWVSNSSHSVKPRFAPFEIPFFLYLHIFLYRFQCTLIFGLCIDFILLFYLWFSFCDDINQTNTWCGSCSCCCSHFD